MTLRILIMLLSFTGFAHAAERLAPDPTFVHEAVVQVYGARTAGPKGIFGVHTWVAVKPSNAQEYTVYEVIGWRLRWNDSVVAIRHRQPDAPWVGSKAELYADKRGAGVDELIRRIDEAAKDYPYAKEYTLWPGPNSNTFTAWIGRAVPEIGIDLPATAIGKDFTGTQIFTRAPSGRGMQVSLGGVLGLSVSGIEGLELNLLSLNFGISSSGIKLPLIGRIGSPSFPTPVALPATP